MKRERRELMIYCLLMEVSIMVMGVLFFNQWVIVIGLCALGIAGIPSIKRYMKRKEDERLEEDFKQMLSQLGAYISLGHSMDNGLKEIFDEWKQSNDYHAFKSVLQRIIISREMNVSLDEIFAQIACDYPMESIVQFSNIVTLTIKKGGTLQGIIESTMQRIEEKEEVENELDVLITQKRYELLILLSMVPLMIIYLRWANESFRTVMYHNIRGQLMMGICLGLYVSSGLIGYRIVNIRV